MIALACDHTGIELKKEMMKLLDSMGLEWKDFGTDTAVSCDYPVYGYRAAKAVASGECDRGILICGTGIGIGIAASKVKGTRVCTCSDVYSAELSKRQEAQAFDTVWRAQLERVASRLRTLPAGTRHPSVFLENRVGLADDCCATMVGLVGVLLDAAGADNVARGRIPGEHGTLNPEFLIATQPRLYIGTGIGSLATSDKSPLRIVLGADATPEAARASLVRATQRRGIAQLQAVQQPGRAHAIWHHYYNSPFNVVAVQVFAKWLHPELFADLDPRTTLQTMFTQFQPIPLTGVYWTSL